MSPLAMILLAQAATSTATSTTPSTTVESQSPPTATATTNGCDPTTDVVGANRCMQYGQMWSAERGFRVVVGTGFFSGAFDASDRDFTANVNNNGTSGTTGYRYDGSRLGIGMVRTYGFDLDIHGFVSEHAYLGFDMAFGVGRAGPRYAIEANGYSFGPTSGADVVQARLGGTFGLRAPARYLSVRLETLVGLEILSISHDATPIAGGDVERASSTNVIFLLEPRIAADIWTAPWATMSLWAGKDVFHLRDMSMGVMFSLHGRSFDGGGL